MYDEVGSVTGRFADNFSFQNDHDVSGNRKNVASVSGNAKWR